MPPVPVGRAPLPARVTSTTVHTHTVDAGGCCEESRTAVASKAPPYLQSLCHIKLPSMLGRAGSPKDDPQRVLLVVGQSRLLKESRALFHFFVYVRTAVPLRPLDPGVLGGLVAVHGDDV